MSPWVSCPDCLHPGWAHVSKSQRPLFLRTRPVNQEHCIGEDCDCRRLTI